MNKDKNSNLFEFQIKKVSIDDLKNNQLLGCQKCKYDKICDYCGLDWRGITKSIAESIKNEMKKERFIDVEKEFNVKNTILENSDIAEHFYLLAKRIDKDLNNSNIKYTALKKLLDLKNDII